MNTISNIVKENAKIVHRNFAGRVDKFNLNGNRTFSLVISDPDEAEQLSQAGWYVKSFKPRDDDEIPDHYIPVTVSYKSYPPKIYIVTSAGVRLMNENEIENIDDFEIANIDLTIRPYSWEVGDKSGVRAYLKTMYVTLAEDEFAYKYQNTQEPVEEV